ncbi:undecaprenyldiphospho-muramoylpentapeptide beta-N-acetylglucosaminyltransferase [Candidatus Palibaumannia cicadellinicola]|uniref:UDP-N-acetylglucosamine--N-acetylmuramyl-(pentapeptide) pyrophosphoryl-undecaprenol N-acetylglucosamine transferase n=1 Tax=Candidatus Palibaumannia cicadellinicola TaxID=186490 RepID=A0A088N289_9GAMM|nr:undecaprenyldiphospho-muramoylpentapeptide beta-N-acetylglucosaminyltransferase [Candidatus Baumannia cicadellinicola]AIN47436.1 UDP-N-acetylglucosamine--N-acetylmuramyl- (pentapeptide) pyrophosphoryl-undecaprenol N-acetylglucosamine transferase [Candidatus Baumannia cicadellinicola]
MMAKRLIIMAGGTGGHVFPGLAVAHYLMAQGWQICWLGTTNGIDADLVSKNGIERYSLCIQGLRGKDIKNKIIVLVSLLSAVLQAKRIMCVWQPDVVLGMGGYVSGPGGLAAWICGIPIVVHEQNSVAGLTNRWLAKIADKVLQAFSGAFPYAKIVGNPVRKELITVLEPSLRLRDRTGPIRILVIGGSQGAKILNQILPAVAAQLSSIFTFWHQVGIEQGALVEVQKAYASIGAIKHQYKVVNFIDDIATAYAWADLVVCRSGALTVSEVATVGLPALFVPFMHKDRQQYWNARLLEQVGAAKIIEQQNFTVDIVRDVITNLDRATLLVMAQRARTIAITDSTERVANEVIAVAQV